MSRTVSENIQEYIRKRKSVFENNKITSTIIILYIIVEAFIAAVPYEYYEDISFFIHTVSRALLYLIIPSLFIETFFAKSKVKCVYGYLIAFIISGVVAPLGDLYIFSGSEWDKEVPYEVEQILHSDGALIKEYAEVYLCVILLALFVAIVYRNYHETKLRFREYAKRVFRNLVKSLVFLIILDICCVYVDSFMAEKFFYWYYFDMFEQVHGTILVLDTFYLGPVGVFVIGFYLGPEMILAFRDMGEEWEGILCKIVGDILPIAILCFIEIIYVCFCMVMIEFLLQMPPFSILSALSCLGLPVLIMTGYDTEKTRYMKGLSFLQYLFVTLFLLQIYFIGIEIYRYGMTRERYVGMMLVLFEMAALFICFFRKGKQKLLLVFGALVGITFFVPGINMDSVSNQWQMSFLKKYYRDACEGKVTSELAYERLTGSYHYLEDRVEMWEAIKVYDIYEESFVTKLKEQYGKADLTRYNSYFMDCEHMAKSVDVSGYSEISRLNQSKRYENRNYGEYLGVINEDGIKVDFSNFQFINNRTGETITVDISAFVEKSMAYKEAFPDASDGEYSSAMKAYNRIELGDDTVLYINKFDVWYDRGIKNAEPYLVWMIIDIDGILLQK